MKIEVLKYIIVMSECKSINEAAQKLYISQPSLSKTLQNIESELGFRIFNRSRSGISLTKSGKQVLDESRQIVRYYNGWLEKGQSRNLENIKFYQHISFSDFLLPNIILSVREKNPHINIDFLSVADPEQYLTSDILNPALALLVCDRKMCQELTRIQGNPPVELMQGEYQCLINSSNPLASMKSITPEDLMDMYLVLPAKHEKFTTNRSFLMPLLNSISNIVSPRKIVEVGSLQNVIDAVRNHKNSYAVSFYPALLRYQTNEDNRLAHIPFSGIDTQGTLSLYYSRKVALQYPAVSSIIDLVKEAAETFLRSIPIDRP